MLLGNGKRKYVALSLALSIALVGSVAIAFPFGGSWMQKASSVATNKMLTHDVFGRAGAGGIYGTGSKMDKGIKCSHCHVESPGMIDAQVDFTPPLSGGTKYTPGQQYQITITLLNEIKLPGPDAAKTLNGFGLTFEGSDGKRAGILRSDVAGVDSQTCPQTYPANNPAGTSYVYGNCDAIIYIPKPDTTTWKMGWTAPSAGKGAVKMWYSVVDGDHEGESSRDDDVKEGVVTLDEGP